MCPNLHKTVRTLRAEVVWVFLFIIKRKDESIKSKSGRRLWYRRLLFTYSYPLIFVYCGQYLCVLLIILEMDGNNFRPHQGVGAKITFPLKDKLFITQVWHKRPRKIYFEVNSARGSGSHSTVLLLHFLAFLVDFPHGKELTSLHFCFSICKMRIMGAFVILVLYWKKMTTQNVKHYRRKYRILITQMKTPLKWEKKTKRYICLIILWFNNMWKSIWILLSTLIGYQAALKTLPRMV